MTQRNARRVALGALAVTLAVAADAAAADDREQCASAAEQAQTLRDDGKYRRAREQMLVCARDVCPGPIKSDCGKWLEEIDRDAPTVVFGAEEHGKDVTDVKVWMDDVALTERLDGTPQLVDAGEHTFKFEHEGVVKEEKVLVRAGEKGRALTVTFGETPATAPPGEAAGAVSPTLPPPQTGSLVPVIAVGAIGVVALGSFAFFGIQGKNDVDDLQRCKPHCAERDVDKARTKLIIADISLGVGAAALIIAGVLYFTRSGGEAKASTRTSGPSFAFDVKPTRGGAAATLGATF